MTFTGFLVLLGVLCFMGAFMAFMACMDFMDFMAGMAFMAGLTFMADVAFMAGAAFMALMDFVDFMDFFTTRGRAGVEDFITFMAAFLAMAVGDGGRRRGHNHNGESQGCIHGHAYHLTDRTRACQNH